MTTVKNSGSFAWAITIGILCLVLFLVRVGHASEMPTNAIRTIDRDIIRLSDVFPTVLSSKDKVLGPAPAPGMDVTLNVRTLMQLASAYGVSWTPTTTEDQVIIKRVGVVIVPADQESALQKAITPQVQGKFQLTFDPPLAPIALSSGSDVGFKVGDIKFDPRNDSFQTTIMPVAAASAPRTVRGRIERLVNVPTPRVGIARGASIAPSDLDQIEMKSTDVRGDIVLNADQIVGRAARQNLAPGRLIRMSDTEVPISVKRGQKVNIVYKVGRLELTALGRAMEDGRVGDMIRVTNGDSNKPLQGTVLASNQVEIDQ